MKELLISLAVGALLTAINEFVIYKTKGKNKDEE